MRANRMEFLRVPIEKRALWAGCSKMGQSAVCGAAGNVETRRCQTVIFAGHDEGAVETALPPIKMAVAPLQPPLQLRHYGDLNF
jgi:hypothetical protein